MKRDNVDKLPFGRKRVKCPVCSIPLIVVERHGIELDYCMTCKGIWFDAGELNLLSHALEIETDLPDIMSLEAVQTQEKERPCPRCDKKMDKVRLQEVTIDRCRQSHGLWFDWGELGQVLERSSAAESGGAHVIKFLSETIRVGERS
jgi:Zn-finger nucleic acid-binding protein